MWQAVCTVVLQDKLFAAAHGSGEAVLSPATFLSAWWAHDGSMAGYQQQDAQSFFLSLLAALGGSTVQQPQVCHVLILVCHDYGSSTAS